MVNPILVIHKEGLIPVFEELYKKGVVTRYFLTNNHFKHVRRQILDHNEIFELLYKLMSI